MYYSVEKNHLGMKYEQLTKCKANQMTINNNMTIDNNYHLIFLKNIIKKTSLYLKDSRWLGFIRYSLNAEPPGFF